MYTCTYIYIYIYILFIYIIRYTSFASLSFVLAIAVSDFAANSVSPGAAGATAAEVALVASGVGSAAPGAGAESSSGHVPMAAHCAAIVTWQHLVYQNVAHNLQTNKDNN